MKRLTLLILLSTMGCTNAQIGQFLEGVHQGLQETIYLQALEQQQRNCCIESYYKVYDDFGQPIGKVRFDR